MAIVLLVFWLRAPDPRSDRRGHATNKSFHCSEWFEKKADVFDRYFFNMRNKFVHFFLHDVQGETAMSDYANHICGLASGCQESCEHVDPSDKGVLQAEEIASRMPATTPSDWIAFATS